MSWSAEEKKRRGAGGRRGRSLAAEMGLNRKDDGIRNKIPGGQGDGIFRSEVFRLLD